MFRAYSLSSRVQNSAYKMNDRSFSLMKKCTVFSLLTRKNIHSFANYPTKVVFRDTSSSTTAAFPPTSTPSVTSLPPPSKKTSLLRRALLALGAVITTFLGYMGYESYKFFSEFFGDEPWDFSEENAKRLTYQRFIESFYTLTATNMSANAVLSFALRNNFLQRALENDSGTPVTHERVMIQNNKVGNLWSTSKKVNDDELLAYTRIAFVGKKRYVEFGLGSNFVREIHEFFAKSYAPSPDTEAMFNSIIAESYDELTQQFEKISVEEKGKDVKTLPSIIEMVRKAHTFLNADRMNFTLDYLTVAVGDANEYVYDEGCRNISSNPNENGRAVVLIDTRNIHRLQSSGGEMIVKSGQDLVGLDFDQTTKVITPIYRDPTPKKDFIPNPTLPQSKSIWTSVKFW